MKNNIKIVMILIVLLWMISALAIGCGTLNNAPNQTVVPATQLTTQAPAAPATNGNQDAGLTERLNKDPKVSAGQVYFSGDFVYCAITLKDSVKEADGKKLAQNYADELAAKYKDKKVNVQAVLKGKSIANIITE